MSAFLVGIADRIRDVWILRKRIFDRVRRDPYRNVGIVAIDDTAAVDITPEPESGVVELCRTPLRATALLDESSGSAFEGEKRRSRIGPDFDRASPEKPHFAVI